MKKEKIALFVAPFLGFVLGIVLIVASCFAVVEYIYDATIGQMVRKSGDGINAEFELGSETDGVWQLAGEINKLYEIYVFERFEECRQGIAGEYEKMRQEKKKEREEAKKAKKRKEVESPGDPDEEDDPGYPEEAETDMEEEADPEEDGDQEEEEEDLPEINIDMAFTGIDFTYISVYIFMLTDWGEAESVVVGPSEFETFFETITLIHVSGSFEEGGFWISNEILSPEDAAAVLYTEDADQQELFLDFYDIYAEAYEEENISTEDPFGQNRTERVVLGGSS